MSKSSTPRPELVTPVSLSNQGNIHFSSSDAFPSKHAYFYPLITK